MRRTRFPLAALTLIPALLVAVGCDTDGPEFPDGETLVFTGSLGEPATAQHNFSLTHSGTIRVVLTEISARNPETGDPIDNPGIIVGIGRPTEDDCVTRVTQLLRQGDSFPVFLEVGEFCAETGRPGNLPMGTLVDYVLTIERAFS